MTRSVALLGYGAVGRSFVDRIASSPLTDVELTVVVMRSRQLEERQYTLPEGVLATDSIEVMLGSKPDIVVEAAGHEAVVQSGGAILKAGCELFLLSVGALADQKTSGRLIESAEQGGGRIVIPAGALGGFDGLLTLRQAGLIEVIYSAMKPPAAWLGTAAENSCDLDRLSEARTFFKGSAREAALSFPKNANLAAAVALAGLGFDRTQVELTADPRLDRNVGRIVARTAGALLEFQLSGSSFESNPKTSQITGLSVVAALINRTASIGYQ